MSEEIRVVAYAIIASYCAWRAVSENAAGQETWRVWALFYTERVMVLLLLILDVQWGTWMLYRSLLTPVALCVAGVCLWDMAHRWQAKNMPLLKGISGHRSG